MAFLGGLLGGGGSDPADIYGDLFSEKQRAALRDQQLTDTLLRLSAGFAKAGQASRLPTGGLLGAIGEAAGGLAGQGDEATNRMLKGMQVAEQVRKSQQERAFAAKFMPLLQEAFAEEQRRGLPQGTLTKPLLASIPQGAPASNAPPTPVGPQPSTGGPAPEGLPGGATSAAGAEWLPNLPAGAAPAAAMPPPIYPLGDPNVPLPRARGKTAGLLDPPPDDGLPGQGVLASLYGGGTGSQSPFGPTTSDPTGPGLPDLSNIKIEQLSGEAAPAGGNWERDRALIRKYESGGRNIEQQVIGPQGGYNPSVGRVTGPSSASGYYQMIDPTWRAAAAKAGIDTSQYPRAINAPEALQDKAAEALYREQGLKPWAPYNSRLAAAAGYQGASGGSGFSGRIESLGGDAVPAGAAPSGKIPGLNTTPEGLALLNSMAKLSGLGEPFGSLLETYYKSPEYLRQSEQVKKDVELETQPKIEAAKAQATQQYIQANDKFKSELEIAKELMVRGGMVRQPDGSYKVITSVQEGLAAVDNAKKTGDIKEYEYYSQNERDRGGIAKPFAVWDAERRKASATSINTTEGLEAAQTKARIAVDQDMAKDANTKALVASQLMPLLDQAMTIARTTPEGFAGPAYKTFGQLAGALGIAVPPGSSNAELLGAINQRMIPMVREPGATAASEMDKYLSAGPALANTADGRVKIIEMTKAINLRAIEVARVIRNNIGAPDLHEKLKALDTPVFSDDQRAAMDAALRVGSPPAATGGAPLPAGAIRTPYGIIERISP